MKSRVVLLKESAFASVFWANTNWKHLPIICVYAYPFKIAQSGSKMPAITNLGFFLAALIKPIHADLLLINFVRRKGRVCIFATRVSPHFKGFTSEAERHLLLRNKLNTEKLDSPFLCDNHNCVSTTQQFCQLVGKKQRTIDQTSGVGLTSFGLSDFM